MLSELRVENLLLIESAHLELGAGLNVLTGETGAGKTVLAQALDLLLGGRARTGIVRPGAREAYVEGVFTLPPELEHERGERLPADASEIVLARRASTDGRTRAYICGRSATVGDLRELGARLISFYGQHEHRRLTLAAAQLEILDGACGPEQRQRLRACAEAHARVRAAEQRREELADREGARERELDLLAFELDEIEQVAPEEAEHAELVRRRERLRSLQALREACGHAEGALGAEGAGAVELLAGAVQRLHVVQGADADLDALADRAQTLSIDLADVASGLARYRETLESEPSELEAVEERLAAIERLMRKHGGSVASVLAHAERCRVRHGELSGAAEAGEQAALELARARADRDELVAALRAARTDAAPRLAEAVRERLLELAMDQARFSIELAPREPGPHGADGVEFLIAPNPGVPAGPVREIASGGELSRVMLALLGVVDSGPDPRVLVFDEIDAGVGGQTSRAVGERLRSLGQAGQLVCITHLPQIASLADRHFSVVKQAGDGSTRTTVVRLDEKEVVGELVRMLGAGEDDVAARRHARELLRAA
ncbi:MAG TPA: DNA repair protein RecN [Solirubrobacteraceae bacterium]|nr:DNA repair protein RecN [Solirubrobacteraceae bacterium]